MDGQEKALREKGIYVILSETEDREIILKAVNRNKDAFTLPLTDEDGRPVIAKALIRTLAADGEKAPGLPEPCCVEETEAVLDGGVVLPGESFTVMRF